MSTPALPGDISQPQPSEAAQAMPCCAPWHEEYERNLLCRVAAGDTTAFEQLYRHYAPRLVIFLRKRLGLSELVEEVLNDVMLVVWRRAAMFRPTACVSTWLFGIARYKAYKARSPHQSCPAEPPGEKSGNGHANPEEILSHQERYRLITCALMTLPPEQRIVVELTYYRCCSAREIAQQLGEAEPTIRSRLRLARQRLAYSLTQQGLA